MMVNTIEKYNSLTEKMNPTNDEMNLILTVEGLSDNIFYYISQKGQSLEEAIQSTKTIINEHHPFSENELNLAIEVVKQYLTKVQVCEKEGHSWIDESFANPEHGGMFIRCTRCGLEEGQWLY
jgi:hypothetical protein